MDLMPTILDYLDISFKDKIDGESLLPILNGAEAGDRMIFLEFPEVSIPSQRHPASFAVRNATHKLIRVFQPDTRQLIGQALFDITTDPLEKRPIRYDDEIELHRNLSKQMDTMLKKVQKYEIPFTLTSYEVPLAKRTKYVEQRKKKGPKTVIKPLSDEQIEKLRSLGYVQ
jgi:arylsulfatase A-like enzyme